MSPDEILTPDQIHGELVRLTGTGDRPSRVFVQEGINDAGIKVAEIVFECDGIPAAIHALPMHLLYPLPEFSAMALHPLAQCWATERSNRVRPGMSCDEFHGRKALDA